MATTRFDTKVRAIAYHLKRGAVKAESTLMTKYVACGIFDTAALDSSGAANTAIGAHGLGVFLPTGAVVVDAWIDVITSFTSAGSNNATIAAKVQATGDLVAAIAISDASNVWNAGIRGALPGSFAEATVAGDTAILAAARGAASMIKLTAERELIVTIATSILTAGKMGIFVEYYIGL